MYGIKQSTAITVPFFAHDVNGDAVTGLTDGTFTKRISKNGAAFGAMTVTISELENGWYSIPLSSSHSDTTGLLTVVFTNGSAKQVNLQWRVEASLSDDVAALVTTVDGVVDSILVDTADMQPKLGSPAADLAADIAAVKVDTAATLVDTSTTLQSELDAIQAAVITNAAGVDVAADIIALKAETALIVADTNELQVDNVPGLIATAQADLDIITGASGVNLLTATQASIDAIEVDTGTTLQAELDGIQADTEDIQTQIGTAGAGLTDLGGMSTGMKAEVNAEALDVLNTDTFAEPAQGTPGATITLAAKIGYLYKFLRNRVSSNATTISVYNDDATTVDHKSTQSDDATTYERGEFTTGP